MNRLKELRKEKKLTQKELADIIGTTKLTVSNWENGKHSMNSDKAQTLADYFGVSVGYLLGFDSVRIETSLTELDFIDLLSKILRGETLNEEEQELTDQLRLADERNQEPFVITKENNDSKEQIVDRIKKLQKEIDGLISELEKSENENRTI
ncbi:helix-turn-helix transcriptional regulator [Streptococcus danieliae]|uniref:helix-turn-helix transcriptional regulator n=1 Tax=Streptococcus danieliae TaxID=747656 RepID=UPI001D166CF5|nr:helix-turn-helix transcriptional regulator [Streptococcus danieliae]